MPIIHMPYDTREPLSCKRASLFIVTAKALGYPPELYFDDAKGPHWGEYRADVPEREFQMLMATFGPEPSGLQWLWCPHRGLFSYDRWLLNKNGIAVGELQASRHIPGSWRWMRYGALEVGLFAPDVRSAARDLVVKVITQ